MFGLYKKLKILEKYFIRCVGLGFCFGKEILWISSIGNYVIDKYV